MSGELMDIFNEAAEILDATKRTAFLDKACVGDRELRGKVDELLSAHAEIGKESGFLGGSDSDGTEGSGLMGECAGEIGDQVGRYKLLQKIGEGGRGIVYMAEQTEPVRRRLALKIIKPGMDSRQVMARFEAERQALAMMNHPNIARVLDAGATETGRPYFVMELVRGVRITDYCDKNRLTAPERMELFIQVCQAVQHAHQKGIIHRDLKPSNILVASDEGVPVPKVIDFGVAKATTDMQLTDKTLFTRFEMFVGTPAYVSPEQAEFSVEGVDTRTDIYALGVLLYELLTGQTPFDGQSLVSAGVDAMRRTIREQEPPKPSTRLRQLARATVEDVAARRQSEHLKLISLVRGDLDWIVMKALEKDRTRRYETANGLALDVQRFLRHEPIRARPPGTLYQFKKLVRRNKLVFASAAAVVLALIAGLGIATVALVKEHHARQEASDRAEESRQRLVRLHVATGNKLANEGNDFNALLWFVEALRIDESDAARADAHRRRIGAMLHRIPGLKRLWWHENFVRGVQFSFDGSRVLSVGWDGAAMVWNTGDGRPAMPPMRTGAAIESALFTRDEKRILTLELGGVVRLWNAENGEQIPLLPTSAKWSALDVSKDGRWFLAGVPGGVRLFDPDNGTPIGPLIPFPYHVEYLGVSPDGSSAVAGGRGGDARVLEIPSGNVRMNLPGTDGLRGVNFTRDGQRVTTLTLKEVRVWDTARWELTLPVLKPGGDLLDCQFSPDGRRFAVASWAGYARVFDAVTGAPVGLPMRHPNPNAGSTFSPDGTFLATASRDGTARLWHVETGEPASPPLPHAGITITAVFSPDGTHLLTASQDRTVRLWDLRRQPDARLVLRHEDGGNIRRVLFTRDGRKLITASHHGIAKIWDAQDGRMLASMKTGGEIYDVCLSPDGKQLLTGADNGMVRVWDVDRAAEMTSIEKLPGRVAAVAFSPDGKRVLASSGARARVWSTSSGEAVTPWMEHKKEVARVAFAPDGLRVATAGLDAVAQVWDAQTGTPTGPALKHDCGVVWTLFSRNGRRLVTACNDEYELPYYAQMWDTATGLPVGPPMPHRDGVTGLDITANGQRIATSSDDDTAMIWDSATGKPLVAPMPHRDDVPMVCFSPDGQLLLTVSADATARVWEVATGEPVTPPLRHDKQVLWGAWRPDGREVVTGSVDGTVRVWDVSPCTEPLARIRREVELLCAHRIEADIGPVPLSIEEIKLRWQERNEP